MKKMFLGSIVVLIFAVVSLAQQSAKIDTSGLTEEQKAQLILQIEKMKKESSAGTLTENLNNPERVNDYVKLGKNIALAVTTVAKELGVAADQFLASTTGKITLALIAWYVVGDDIIGIIGGTVAWIVIANIILWSFRFFHMSKKVVQGPKDNLKIEYVQRYKFENSDAKVGSAVIHIVAFVVITGICLGIVFG